MKRKDIEKEIAEALEAELQFISEVEEIVKKII